VIFNLYAVRSLVLFRVFAFPDSTSLSTMYRPQHIVLGNSSSKWTWM